MRRCSWLVSCVLLLATAPALAAAGTAHRSARPATFASCASLVGYAQRHFAVTHGVADPPLATGEPTTTAPTRVPLTGNQPAAAVQAPSAAGTTTPTYSTTNNQEVGVDEPDIAKTDGRTLFTVAGSELLAVTVGGTPRLAGSLDLGSAGYGGRLLLRGSRLIVISSSGGYAVSLGGGPAAAGPAIYPGGGATSVQEVDVRDPAAMRITRTMTIDGAFVDARQNGATARLVISSAPRALVVPGRRSSAGAWVPRRRFHSALTGHSYVRPVAPCRTIRRPVDFSGLGMLTIFTLDLDRGLYTADTSALMADAQVVYGSASSLYVATQKWIDPRLGLAQLPPAQTTVIDRFDVGDPSRTTLAATGEVPGYLLNQFSLSEYRGYLRAATTSRPIWWGGAPPTASRSSVTVLARTGTRLVPVGQVSGLGAGQQIYSVRFVGDTGYVVTFRSIDPLYAIDLRSPSAPRVAGKLELAGYSSYLQPLGSGLLLGIGQDVSSGGNEPNGTQLELFDVSDPNAPRLVERTTVGSGSSSEVQYDHHAFLYWPPTGLAVLPVQIYPQPGPVPTAGTFAPAPGFVGAIGYHVDRSGISEVGRIAHAASGGYLPTIRRSIVVGDRLFTVSDAGVLASALDTLAPQTFVAFPASAMPPPGPIALAGAGAAAAR
ncbi:MAG: beta-propeller domain-containing protein [Solirubrobacteraceae bacterium]